MLSSRAAGCPGIRPDLQTVACYNSLLLLGVSFSALCRRCSDFIEPRTREYRERNRDMTNPSLGLGTLSTAPSAALSIHGIFEDTTGSPCWKGIVRSVEMRGYTQSRVCGVPEESGRCHMPSPQAIGDCSDASCQDAALEVKGSTTKAKMMMPLKIAKYTWSGAEWRRMDEADLRNYRSEKLGEWLMSQRCCEGRYAGAPKEHGHRS